MGTGHHEVQQIQSQGPAPGLGQIQLIGCQILFSYISFCMLWAVPFDPGWDHGVVTRYVLRAALRRAISRKPQHSQTEMLILGTVKARRIIHF